MIPASQINKVDNNIKSKQYYARELLNEFGKDYAAIPRLALLLKLLEEETKPEEIKIVSTIEFLDPKTSTLECPIWLKGNIIEVRLYDIIVETIKNNIYEKCSVSLKNIRII